jgi:AraC-like DNA-binding protein
MLQRHFRPLGETPGHRLLNRRLELAHARLTARREQPSEGVTAVAFDCGFNDLSYFYREFRKKYGATPGAVARCH